VSALIEALERRRDIAVAATSGAHGLYSFGARDLLVTAADEAALPGSALRPGGDASSRVELHIIEPLDLPVTSRDRRGPYDALLDCVGTDWLVLHHPDTGHLLALDRRSRVALLAPGRAFAPRERAEFCRPLLHWLAVLDGHVAVHAGAVAVGDRGILVAGTGNAGKSTLARACLAAGLGFLGDNVVEVAVPESATGPSGTQGRMVMFGVYPTVKVRPGSVVAIPDAWPAAEWDDEAAKHIHFLGETVDLDFRSGATDLVATLVLDENGPAAPRVLGTAEAFFRIAPNTVAQFPFFEAEVLSRSGRVAAAAPTYLAGRLPPDRIPDTVAELVRAVTVGCHA
jgi:hypothetical protein